VRPNGPLESNAPTVVARAPVAAPPAGGAATRALHEAEGATAAVWESLGADTHTLAQGDTGPTGGTTQPLSRTQRAAPKSARKRVLLYAAVGGLLLVGAVAGVYFACAGKPPGPTDPGPPQARRIIVSRAGGENAVATLREAISKAGPGDTIVIAEPRVAEPLPLALNRIRHKDLTIESGTPDGKPAVVDAGPTGGVLKVLLDAVEVEGLRIRNVEFDGGSRADVGIQLVGFCPGATLQNVTVRNVKGAAVRVQNAAGEQGRPILLDHVRLVVGPTADGLVLLTTGGQVDNRRVVVRDSRFEGQGRAGVRIDGAATDLEITGNRFFGNEAAVTFPKLTANLQLKVQVSNNTVCQAKVGFQFEFAPPDPKRNLVVLLNQNYFARTEALAAVNLPPPPPGMPPPPVVSIAGVNSADNAHDPATCKPGNVQLAATPLPAPVLPAPDLNNDAAFLRFPGGPPEVAGEKVGAP
jgi:hypothetical protein